MLCRPVHTKIDFVQRYQAGEFGNRSPTWNRFSDWLRDIWDVPAAWKKHRNDLYHIRNRVAGGPTWYNCPAGLMWDWWAEAISHEDPENLYISAMAPTDLTTLQGEVERTHKQLSLFYSQQTLPMRDALKTDGKQVYGLRAAHLLQRHLNVPSYEWLTHLLDEYPGHVVEFSAYDKLWGTVPGYNTVFWEVRRY